MRSLFRFIAVASALSLLSFLLTYRQLQRNVSYVLPLFAPPRLPSKAIVNCTHATCFNASLCAREHRDRPLNRISVFVYHPTVHVYDSGQHIKLETSNEQFELLSTIRASRYATDNPFEACVFVPSVDLLNGFDSYANLSLRILTALPWWNNGANHLIFSILPGRRHQFSGLAISASAAHFMPAYRPTFDISIPAFNPMRGVDYDVPVPHARHLLTILPTYSQADLPGLKLLLSSYRESSFCHNVSILMFDRPDIDRPLSSYDDFRSAFLSTTPYKQAIRTTTPYIKALSESLFCAIIRISAVGQIAVFDAMSTGCIPIIADDRYVLPFSEVLDWSKFSVRVRATELHSIPSLLASFGGDDVARFQRQLQFVFFRYFSSMSKIAMTTLDIINDRVFPYYSRSYAEWNNPDYRHRLFPIQPLIFYPTRSALGTGFTLLVRGHHHFSLLHELLIRLNSIPLLRRIVVVWTNRNIPAPSAALWPSLSVPFSLVHANDVNGRYFPFPLIETEAVLSLEDHNCAPSVEQIQLAFELWCQNPDRLVGIPPVLNLFASRSHSALQKPRTLLSATFGASFFHKHYLHSYTELFSNVVLNYVKTVSSCEDVLLNWLIVQLSDKPVLTVHGEGDTSSESAGECHIKAIDHCSGAFTSDQLYENVPGVPFEIAAFIVKRN